MYIALVSLKITERQRRVTVFTLACPVAVGYTDSNRETALKLVNLLVPQSNAPITTKSHLPFSLPVNASPRRY